MTMHMKRLSSFRLLFTLALSALVLAAAGCGQQQPKAASPRRNVPAYCPPVAPGESCPVPAVTVSPLPVWQPVAGRTVILDAGHGGNDNGASQFGLREKDINLDLALRTAQYLQAKGVRVLLVRQSDVFVPLPERSAFANRNPNAVFVSLHVNAAPSNPNARGIETFVLSKEFSDADRSKQASSKFKMAGSDTVQGREALANLTVRCRNRGPSLATSIQRSLIARLGETDRGVKTANLAVLRETYFCPAVLVEVGFLTNTRTAESMRTEEWRRRTAEGVAEGIAEFLRQPE